MHKTHTNSIDGYRPRHLSLARYNPEGLIKSEVIVILDIHDLMECIKRDRSIWVVRDALPVSEIIESLIEEELSPSEYPRVMDIVSEYVDKRPDVANVLTDDTLTIAAIQLEHYQLVLDGYLTRRLSKKQECLRYEVVRWLGDTTLAVSINPHYRRSLR